MRSQLGIHAVVVASALIGCGDNHGTSVADGAPLDSPLPPGCSYVESHDSANAETAEATGLTVGATTQTLCGQVDVGDFNGATQTVDVDSYAVTVGATTANLLVQFVDASPASLSAFTVEIFDSTSALINSGVFAPTLGDHGAFLSELPTGSYNIVVVASGSAAPTAAISYKVRLAVDDPARCPVAGTTAPAYTEANDGSDNHGNDVIAVDFTQPTPFTLTADTTDAPEPTALTIDAGSNAVVAGSSALVAAGSDQYLDRDTFEITTGSAANELSVRLDWPGATADLDYLVFPENSLTETAGTGTLTSTTAGEFATFPVVPSSKYWLWVGATTASTGLPLAYTANVCGGQFTP